MFKSEAAAPNNIFRGNFLEAGYATKSQHATNQRCLGRKMKKKLISIYENLLFMKSLATQKL